MSLNLYKGKYKIFAAKRPIKDIGTSILYHVRLNTYDKSDAEMLKYKESENFIS